MSNIVQRSVLFYDNDLMAIRYNDEDYAAIRPICDALGIDWSAQRQRIERDEVLSATVVVIPTVGADGKQRDMTCLPLKMLNGWLFGVDPKRIRPENREALIRYKLECYDALARAFNNPAASFAPVHHRLERLEVRVEVLERAAHPLRPYTPRPLRRTPVELPTPKPSLRERMTEEHLLILALLDEGDARGITTKHLLAACGVTRERPGVFYSRLRELRAEGYVAKADHKTAPNRITDEGRAVLNECSGAA